MEIKHLALEEFKADDETRTIEGYGSIFGNVDGQGDMVLPGAFGKCLERMRGAGQSIKMLWQHKMDMPIGVWERCEETPEGLYLKGRICDTSHGQDAYKLLKAGAINGLSIGYGVKDFALDRKSGTRLLKELELYEVSLVTFPANDKATVTRVKSAGSDIDTAVTLLAQAMGLCRACLDGGMAPTPEMIASLTQMMQAAVALLDDRAEAEVGDAMPEEGMAMTEREFEKFLRDAGKFSRKQAMTIIARGYKAIADQRDVDGQELHTLCTLFNQFKR